VAGIRVKIEVEGLKEVRAKLREDVLLAGPWTAAMRRVEDIARASWMGAMPADSGQARAKITTAMQAKPVPMWVRVKTTASRSSRKHRNYRYPNRQEYDPRSRNKGRLTRSIEGAQGRVQGALNQAARDIEAKWNS
jgi:ribosomal protein L39E